MTDEQFRKELEKIQQENHQIELKNKLKFERNKYRRLKIPKFKTSNIVLASSIVAVALFTAISLYIQYTTGIEVSSTLTTLWYSFWTVEIVSLAGIKVSKVFKNYNNKNNDINSVDDCNYNDDCCDSVG